MLNFSLFAGLNPKSCRAFSTRHKLLYNPVRNILDGGLLWQYIHLPLPEKRDLAKKVGTNMDDLIYELREIDCSTAHF